MHIHSVRLVIGTGRLTWTNFATVSVATATATGAAALLQVVGRIGLISTLLDTLRESTHPPGLVLVGRCQQEHLAGMVRVMMQLARGQWIVIVHVFFVKFEATSLALVGG